MPRRKLEVEPLDCEPIPLSELEAVVKEVMDAPLPDDQRWENREPTQEERAQKFKLKRQS